MQEHSQSQVAALAGNVRVRSGHRPGGLALVAEGPGGRTEAHFHGARPHALPASIENPRIVEIPATGASRTPRLFEVHSEQGSWRLQADSVQVHEHPALFGRVVPLPGFRLRRRIPWTLLLWVARFHWGRRLIGRLTSRKRRATR